MATNATTHTVYLANNADDDVSVIARVQRAVPPRPDSVESCTHPTPPWSAMDAETELAISGYRTRAAPPQFLAEIGASEAGAF